MDKKNDNNKINNPYSTESIEFCLDNILEEYSRDESASGYSDSFDDIQDNPSRDIKFAAGTDVSSLSFSSAEDLLDAAIEPEYNSDPYLSTESGHGRRSKLSRFFRGASNIEREYDPDPAFDLDIDFDPEPVPASELETESISETQDDEYAAKNYPPYDDNQDEPSQQNSGKPSALDRLISQVIALIAMAVERHGKKKSDSQAFFVPDSDEPEVPLEKAAKHYMRQSKPLRLRLRLAVCLSVIICYISLAQSWGMPLPGALGSDNRIAALVCLIIELSVVAVGLDIFTNGITSLFRLSPRLDSLVSLSCVFSAVDAAVISASGASNGLPFCAVAAVSLTLSIYSSRLTCRGLSYGLKTAAQATDPQVVTVESDIADGLSGMIKSNHGTAGFVRRSEAADMAENAYAFFSPFLIVASLVLALFAVIGRGTVVDLSHAFSGILSATASFSAFLAFSMPFFITARNLYHSGAAIAGSAGCSDIGKSGYVVLTDGDLFPAGTVTIDNIRILEGVFNDKVISYTGSMIAASGSGLSDIFSDLMKRNNCIIHKVDNFAINEGGGLTAHIGGEQVYVGTTGFMHLMGVVVPHNIDVKNTVLTSIGGVLVGIFNINYESDSSAKNSLLSLMHNRSGPLFAVRDFNISPLLIKECFHMPHKNFDFPSYAERFRISGLKPHETSQISAVLSREGLGTLAEVSDRGRRMFRSARLCVALSVVCSFLGLILMFIFCRAGAYDSATVANLLSYLFLWLVPVLVITAGLRT